MRKASHKELARTVDGELARGSLFLLCFAWAAFLCYIWPSVAKAQQTERELAQANAYHRQGDYAHSIPLLRRLRDAAPRSYPINLYLGQDLLHAGNPAEAIGPLQQAASLRPQEASVKAYLADAAASSGNYALAADALQQGLRQSGDSQDFLEAWAHFCLERYRILDDTLRATRRGEAVALRVEAASHPEGTGLRESLLRESANADQEQPGIWAELGIAQLELHQDAALRASLHAAEQYEPESVDTLQFEALVAARDGNMDRAEILLAAIAKRSPTELRNALALRRHVLNQAVEPNSSFARCAGQTSAGCSVDFPTGLTSEQLYRLGSWEKLLALAEPPSAASADWLRRGVAYARTGQCRQTILALERGIQTYPIAAGFWLEMCYSGEAERAAMQLRNTADQATFHQIEGDILLSLRGDGAHAAEEYEQALKVHPRDPFVLEKLSAAQFSAGDLKGARQSAQAALAIDPHRREALHTLAAAAMRERDYEQALPWLRRLAIETPEDRAVDVEMAKALAQTGHPLEAAQHLEPILAAGYPDERGALHALEARVLRELGRSADADQAAAEARRLSDDFQAHHREPRQARSDADQ